MWPNVALLLISISACWLQGPVCVQNCFNLLVHSPSDLRALQGHVTKPGCPSQLPRWKGREEKHYFIQAYCNKATQWKKRAETNIMFLRSNSGA